MQTVITRQIPGASADELFTEVADLGRYPAWMRFIHRVEPLAPDPDVAGEERPAWWVELRARVGPFTRSKQLRMVRTGHERGRRARFERAETDGRDHAAWTLTATVAESAGGAMMTMELAYDGDLWSRAVLGRILDAEVERATAALTAKFTADGATKR